MANTTVIKAKSDGAGYALFVVPTLSSDQTYTLPVSGGNLGGNDYMATLASAEISITGTGITATISRQHVCSGTTSDYTVTLPAASGNTGKFIGIRIDAACTKLITIDGNASETIDGSLTRIMWANEWCMLYCDGSNWFKVAGKSIPMAAGIYKNGDQALTTGVLTKITSWTTLGSSYTNVAAMEDAANGKIVVKRPGRYMWTNWLTWKSVPAAQVYTMVNYVNGAAHSTVWSQAYASTNQPTNLMTVALSCAVGDYIELYGQHYGGSNASALASSCWILLEEIPQW